MEFTEETQVENKPEFLNLGTLTFVASNSLYTLDVNSTPNPNLHSLEANVSGHCQMSCGGQNHPQLRSIANKHRKTASAF